jgi:hypothetical protein
MASPFQIWLLTILALVEIPPVGSYKVDNGFNGENRTYMPKTTYYSFGNSATRESFSKVYNEANNSPREIDARSQPGPGQYTYKNKAIGQEGRRFSFLQRTKNIYGKSNSSHGSSSVTETHFLIPSCCPVTHFSSGAGPTRRSTGRTCSLSDDKARASGDSR